MKLQIVGLGPGPAEDMTLRAAEALLSGRRVLLRTRRHPVAAWLEAQGVEFSSLDALYEGAEDFSALTDTLTAAVRAAAEEAEAAGLAPLIYAVPGHGLLEEDTAAALAAEAELIPGLPVALDVQAPYPDLSRGAALLPVTHAAALKARPELPTFITQLDDAGTAGEAKLALAELWGDEAEALFTGETTRVIPLYQADWQEDLSHNARLLLDAPAPGLPRDVAALEEVVRLLRAPLGCPWDREQTHASLSRYLVEEALEAQDALDAGDPRAMVSELGDILLQVVMQAAIGAEEDEFTLRDIAESACAKMERRHPQLFGRGPAEEWEELKRKETGQTTVAQAMKALSATLPALLRAEKVQHKAAKVGFDWDDAAAAMDKVLEEAAEVLEARGTDSLEEEVGDLLFSAVNAARLLGIEPETALRRATDKFIRRFSAMEAKLREQNRPPEQCSPGELDAAWEAVKAEERQVRP